MIEHRIGNLLEQPDIDVIIHQCNPYHTFGSGIALAIKNKYPEVYAADLRTPKDLSKLGSYSTALAKDDKIIVNLYSQVGISYKDRVTSYDAMARGFKAIEQEYNTGFGNVLGVPEKIGCGLANGSWRVVYAILEDVFLESSVKLVICRLNCNG